MDTKPFLCTTCEDSFQTPDNVVVHIATRHAQGVPLHEVKTWFDEPESDTPPVGFITEAGGDML